MLEQYKGPNIDEFRVNFDLRNKHRSDIDRWVEFALSNRVHTFELNLLGNDNNQSNYTFPCQLLGLSSKGPCLRNPSMFVGFKSLKSLSLKAVDVGYEGIEHLLSNCRLLERLFLHQNCGLRHLKVHSPSPMLRYLEVVGSRLKTKVVKTGPARPVQSEKPGTELGTGPIETEKSGRAKNRDKTGHPLVEPVTRLTRCRVNRFFLFFPSFDHAAPFLKKLHSFLTFYFIDFF